jgi:hypothetical protein
VRGAIAALAGVPDAEPGGGDEAAAGATGPAT